MLEAEWSRLGELRCLCVTGDGVQGMLTGPDAACERIVSMVNSHADLLAALEWAVRIMHQNEEEPNDNPLYVAARSAIEKARLQKA